MKKNNKTCIVCSKVYTYCPTCGEFKKYPKWMSLFCCEDCKKAFEVASSYLANEITKEEAKAILDGCDLSNKANFTEKVLSAIEEIYTETSSTSKTKKKIVTPQPEVAEVPKE